MSPTLPAPFASEAWLLIGLTRTESGRLEWKNGRLRLATGAGTVFDVAPGEVAALSFPWYYFGGGAKLTARGKRYRLSFVRPNDADHAIGRGVGEAGNPVALLIAALKITDVRNGRRLGRRWRETLVALCPDAR